MKSPHAGPFSLVDWVSQVRTQVDVVKGQLRALGELVGAADSGAPRKVRMPRQAPDAAPAPRMGKVARALIGAPVAPPARKSAPASVKAKRAPEPPGVGDIIVEVVKAKPGLRATQIALEVLRKRPGLPESTIMPMLSRLAEKKTIVHRHKKFYPDAASAKSAAPPKVTKKK